MNVRSTRLIAPCACRESSAPASWSLRTLSMAALNLRRSTQAAMSRTTGIERSFSTGIVHTKMPTHQPTTNKIMMTPSASHSTEYGRGATTHFR
ncbi:Uncharacterised protein [Mycobacteroides abscessus subsp. abscessus]|nr:Uncharacterised protein [Mycobacteroides abscessus subsp. abscessus]